AAAQVAVIAGGVGLQVFLARALGAEDFGTYSFLSGVFGLFLFAAHMNLHQLLARRVARAPETANEAVGLGLSATACLAWIGGACVVTYVWLLDGRPHVVATAFAT